MWPGIPDNWKKTEEQPGRGRDCQGKQHHDQINRNTIQQRNTRWCEVKQQSNSGPCNENTEQPADDSQKETFEKQFTCNSATSSAEGRSDREFLLAAVGTHQQQVCNVGRCDQ